MVKHLCRVIVVFVVFAFSAQANDVGLRIRFGLTDKAPTKWDGTVTVHTVSGQWSSAQYRTSLEGAWFGL